MTKAPRAHSRKFFVYVVESLSAVDHQRGRSEGELLKHAASLDEMPAVVQPVEDKESFLDALVSGLAREMKRHPDRMPIVHISAHGAEKGIGFTRGKPMAWQELRDPLMRLNQASRGKLLLCMSSCVGFAGCQMAMDLRAEPFLAIVGCTNKPTWSDTAVGFAAFYHHLSDGQTVAKAVKALNAASGRSDWEMVSGRVSRNSYIDGLVDFSIGQMIENLESFT